MFLSIMSELFIIFSFVISFDTDQTLGIMCKSFSKDFHCKIIFVLIFDANDFPPWEDFSLYIV